MTAHSTAVKTQSLPYAARALVALFRYANRGSLRLDLPTGEHMHFQGAQSGYDAVLTVNDWRAFGKILRSADIGLAEAYRDHWCESPDLTALLHWAMSNEAAIEQVFKGSFWGTLFYRLRHLVGRRNTKAGSKKNIHAHYDLGNDFYRLWLDPSMTYSSARFNEASSSLTDAQHEKYQRILSRLSLPKNAQVLEIGCGWGGFAERLLQQTDSSVVGLSLSQEQLKWARERLDKQELGQRADLRYQDYRDVHGSFNAVVSIEMIEAVGQSYWPSYFKQLHDCVKPGGYVALQAITIGEAYFEDYLQGTDFIQQYIFPGGMLLSLSEIHRQAERAGLKVIHSERFGEDYAETLRRWRASFEAEAAAIQAQGFDEAFMRIWRFYLCYCEAAFDAQRTDVYQVFLRRPITSDN